MDEKRRDAGIAPLTITGALATMISAWNISGIWSGIACMLSAVVTIGLVWMMTGGFDERD